MRMATVVGTAIATMKHESMNGQKLLVVQPWMADGTTADGFPQIAVDSVGAGMGQAVMLTSDGRGAREWLRSDNTPVRWTVIGIRDE